MTRVGVAPTKYALGLNGTGRRVDYAFEILELADALTRVYRTDAHLVTYVVGEGAVQPRVNKPGVCDAPALPMVESFFCDVDNPLASLSMVEDHLVLVLVNLMLNAADAMPDGGTLSISAKRVEGRVVLRVRDTGAGMSTDVLAKAMTPMFTTKARGRGTRLGLAVCSNVVHAVGGELALSSTVGLGTEVAITLPAAGGDDA